MYGGYHRNADDAFIYMDGGRIRNKLHRNLSAPGLGTEAKYHSNIFEIGGENEFAHGWMLGGDIQLQKGRHDRDLSTSVMVRKEW